ncbi:DctP family TRAP transporter solute-binding subunit [Virgibacillus sp. W0430]|uniref:DctP family TRAP transporter solute-binding subunit n=1 Tax=Virgibacillus sp. W0430 TaxID=3391580 RepID=UPI003F474E76
MNRKQSIFSAALILILGLFLTACGGGEDKQASETKGEDGSDPIIIKFSHVVDETTPKGKAANMFQELVAERLDGKVEVEVYPASQLYDDDAGLEALEAGNIQMMAPSNSKMIGLDKSFDIFLMPYLFNSGNAVLEFSKSDIGQELYSSVDKYNIQVLTTWLGGEMHLTNDTREIKTPEDMKGLKFRVMSSGILADHFEALGAGATVISFSELYMALQQGTVDGQENPYNNIESQKFHEVQSYLTETAHSIATYPLIVNKEFWGGLPEDIRAELDTIVDEVTDQQIAWTAELNEEAKQKIIDSGNTKVTTLTDEEKKAFIEKVEPIFKEQEEAIGKEAIEFARTLE